LIAGSGPEESHLRGLISRGGLDGKVFLLGQREDAAAVFQALDIFVLSSWGEGMGSVLLEAGACAVPVAATGAGGIPEIVEDGVSGLLAPPRNPEALAANIVRLLDDRALAARLAQNARKRLPLFGLAHMVETLEPIYESVIKRRHHR
jgi:glycosyltransferase involved in cell wall biosynthesis